MAEVEVTTGLDDTSGTGDTLSKPKYSRSQKRGSARRRRKSIPDLHHLPQKARDASTGTCNASTQSS